MFGHPSYFQAQKSGLPRPARLSGWLFYIIWSAAILVPAITMLFWGQYVQLVVWLMISIIWFSFDTFSTARNIHRKTELDQLFYVGEEDSHVSTRNYDLNLRSSSTETN